MEKLGTKAIGGYFELELNKKSGFHKGPVLLNSARNALEYILSANACKKLYLPYFVCDVVLQPAEKLKIETGFYSLDQNLEPIFEFSTIKNGEAFLYVNYFGLKDGYIDRLSQNCPNLIIDNSQAFFSNPHEGVDTFYSPRKFFGVPDGAYLYPTKKMDVPLKKDVSHHRFAHLIKRIDLGAEAGFEDFRKNDASLDNQEIMEMSNLTKRILQSIDYEKAALSRRKNFDFLAEKLDRHNRLKLKLNDTGIPMVYPFLTNGNGLRQCLIDQKIYVARYWPNVLGWVAKNSFEHELAHNMVSLPIDQRYGKKDMERIIKAIEKEC